MDAAAVWIRDYIARQQAALAAVPPRDVHALMGLVRQAWREGRLIVVIGNGGSAASASHFAVDLGKAAADAVGRSARVLALTDSVPWITAVGNDCSYDDVFVRQLRNVASRGDLLIGLSVSGNSPNILRAVEWARSQGLRTAALVGGNRGRLSELAELVVAVGDTHYGRVEDVHMNVLHMVCYAHVECGELIQDASCSTAPTASQDLAGGQ